MKKIFISAFAFLGFALQSNAQQSATLSADLVSPMLKGYTLEAGYNKNNLRITAAYGTLDAPAFLTKQGDDLLKNRTSVDFGLTKFHTSEQKGLNYGIGFGFVNESIQLLDSKGDVLTGFVGKAENSYTRIGGKVGYIWMPFSGGLENLFVEPAVQLGIALGDGTNFDNGFEVEKALLKLSGPSINIGWRFDL